MIVGVGETCDRPADLSQAKEPLQLMAEAARRADEDAGGGLLDRIDSLDVINEISWPYADPPGLVCERLAISPPRKAYRPVGGQTPLLSIHEAALRIAAGQSETALICGAEAEHSVRAARKAGSDLGWSTRVEDFQPVRGAFYQGEIAHRLAATAPAHVYPLFENAMTAAWGQSPAEAARESAELWSAYSEVAATRPDSWIRQARSPEQIGQVSERNRMIAWPYPKLMTANPVVNQGAAVLVASLGAALRAGVGEERLVFILGGAAAESSRDYLLRPDYASSPAMAAVLGAARQLSPDGFACHELYSCFPCVPKLARRTLGLDAEASPTVAGGLTFFGAPLNNYMTHAAAAMTHQLRASADLAGLLYGQGEYMTKHHALVLAKSPPAGPLSPGFSVQDQADALTAAPPELTDDHDGTAQLETFTVLFEPDGAVRHGVAIALTPGRKRLMARVPAADAQSLAVLMNKDRSPVGSRGQVLKAPDGVMEWRHG